MKKLINLVLMVVTIKYSIASPIDESLMNLAYAQGVNIYHSCIVPPPADSSIVAYCNGLYANYLATLTTINAPFPLMFSQGSSPYESPYAWSPYDICRYEVAHMIFNSVTQSPYYCPTL